MNMQHIAAVTVLLAAAVVPVANAVIINVPGDQPTIQAGIDAAVNGDEVVVAEGTYLEAINFSGKAITVRSTGPMDPAVVANTIIDGTGNLHVVRCVSREGPDSVLSGFTITGGNAIGNFPEGRGGGMWNVGSSPTVTHCVFRENLAFQGGAGMYNSDGNPTVVSCLFIGNHTTNGSGGGMMNFSASPEVTNCAFIANTNTAVGGGMYNGQFSDATVTNCTFGGNAAVGAAGGIYNITSDPMVTNCIVWGNSPSEISGNATVTFSNVRGGQPGAGNIDADPQYANFSDCCYVSNNGSGCDDPLCEAIVCAVGPWCCNVSWKGHCVEQAEELCGSLCAFDLRLTASSPSIDAGDNTAVPEDITTDLDGNPRFLEIPETPDTGIGTLPIVDMGAYESLGGGCLAVTSQEIVCHANGTTFTVTVEGLNACTGGTTQVTFTASGGAVGEQLCFTALVNDGGFCCSTEICVTVPDCSESEDIVCSADLDNDGMIGITDFLFLLAVWGTPDADIDGDGDTGITDFLQLLSQWGPCP